METKNEKVIVATTVKASIEKVWECWTKPEHITQWNNASDEWYTPKANNDLKKGGRFEYRMEARDGSMGFDFGGTYTDVKEKELLAYTLDDDRIVTVEFSTEEDAIKVTETFEAENTNPVEMQKAGWQAIMNNYKKYAESI